MFSSIKIYGCCFSFVIYRVANMLLNFKNTDTHLITVNK